MAEDAAKTNDDAVVDTHLVSNEPSSASSEGITRRSMLISSALAALSFGTTGYAFGMGRDLDGGGSSSSKDVLSLTYPFRGEHQSGILTPAQQQMYTMAFDVAERMTLSRLQTLFQDWTQAAEAMCKGEPVESMTNLDGMGVPKDTGETYDSGAAGLTITFGVGATFFEKNGEDRFGLKKYKPGLLAENFRWMKGDDRFMDDAQKGGDVVVQVCAEDPMVTLHAVHMLKKIAIGKLDVKWAQLGYGRTSSTSKSQATPRNLFGFKDGTSNITAEENVEAHNKDLWIQPDDDGGAHFAGGTYMCTRRIRMTMERWDFQSLGEQESTVGRDKVFGAPLSSEPREGNTFLVGEQEFDAPDFTKKDASGRLMIPQDSHVAVVHPDNNDGHRMLRRGYNFVDGHDSLGNFDAGLFFVAFVRRPDYFEKILTRMTNTDAMSEYLQHTGSALFVMFPGVGESKDEYIGQSLLEAK
ncbi:MAG: Dyp-type peroxidase [Actinomycetaceae bacterium]|nr:Dyp-type peroxidase [Actinomycetaceae bacterium]